MLSCCCLMAYSTLAEHSCPDSVGGQMDAPLILTTQISPSEIDKEALNVDINNNIQSLSMKLLNNTHLQKPRLL